MKAVIDFIVTNHLGDLASVIAVIITLVGFGFSLFGIWRSKTAAERAEEAASNARKAITQFDRVAAISAAITSMEEVKRLHRVMAWNILPDRYAEVRKALISVRSSNPPLPPECLAAIQGAIQHFTEIENEVEKALALGRRDPSQAKLNEIVSRQIDKFAGFREIPGTQYLFLLCSHLGGGQESFLL